MFHPTLPHLFALPTVRFLPVLPYRHAHGYSDTLQLFYSSIVKIIASIADNPMSTKLLLAFTYFQ